MENYRFKVWLVTPALAMKLLEKNTSNRAFRQKLVDRYKRLMLGGLWVLNGESIKVSKTGRLLDGQHRLHAVVSSGCSVEMLVVEGLPDSVFDTIDDGKRRSASDVVGILGEKNAAQLAATLGVIERVRSGAVVSGTSAPENSKVIELLSEYRGASRSVATVGKAMKLCSPSLLSGLHWWFSVLDVVQADRFVEDLLSGANLSDGDPVLVLRERLLANRDAKAKLPKGEIAAIIIKAFNARVVGVERLRYLRWRRDELFPQIHGLKYPLSIPPRPEGGLRQGRPHFAAENTLNQIDTATEKARG